MLLNNFIIFYLNRKLIVQIERRMMKPMRRSNLIFDLISEYILKKNLKLSS